MLVGGVGGVDSHLLQLNLACLRGSTLCTAFPDRSPLSAVRSHQLADAAVPLQRTYPFGNLIISFLSGSANHSGGTQT